LNIITFSANLISRVEQ